MAGSVSTHWDGSAWRRNFGRMSLAFALCQATVTTPIGFATSLLDPAVGQIGTGVLMLGSMFSSLLLGAPIVSSIGAKAGLLVAMTCSTSYAMLFALATFQEPSSGAQWAAYVLGAILSGCGSGILWTAQGAFFVDTSALVAKCEGKSPEQVTASLSGRFASVLLVLEITLKLSASLLQGTFLQWKLSRPLVSLGTMFFLFACVAAATIAAMGILVTAPIKPESDSCSGTKVSVVQKVTAAFRLWSSPEIWCLSFTNLTFGFCAGYMNGFVNGAFTKPSPTFGAGSLGTLLATTSFVASATAALCGALSQRTGKGLTISLGAACFAAIPVSVLLFTPSEANGYWGASLISLYVLQGMGRAVYESTNKAVFADFFPGEKSAGAFANCMMQNSVAFFASFILQSSLEDKSVLAWIVLILAALTLPGYLAASRLRRPASASLTQSLLTERK